MKVGRMSGMAEKIGRIIKTRKLSWKIELAIHAFICSFALQNNTLKEVEWGYYVDIPVIKWFFTIFQQLDGRGMEVIFLMFGLACLFYFVKDCPSRKNPWIRGIAAFFSICMIFGKSYYELANWNYIFHGRLQFGLACFVFLGYYWVFKDLIVFLGVIANKWIIDRNVPQKKLEKWLFERHPFLGPLLIISVCCLPVMIIFFPGTLQADAQEQLWTYIGAFAPWTKHHPVALTWLLGQCLHISRTVFGNDGMAMFLFAGPQYVIQWLVFAYGCYVIGRLKAPLLLRWGTLIYFAVFPLWQIWGYTVAKDSCYYIFLLLMVLLFVHIFESGKIYWWQYVLIGISSVAVINSRNNGIHVLILFLPSILLAYKKYWKACVLAVLCILLSRYVVDGIYVSQKGILPTQTGEMLSIPLQQTARYVKEHYDEITEEEMDVLSWLFQVEVRELAELYSPEWADPVKGELQDYPTVEDLGMYFKVWFAQLCKHPDTYIQAFLNHTYGYFYPNRYNTYGEFVGRYTLFGNTQYWKDGHLDYTFAMEYRELRDMFEKEADIISRLPLVSILYGCGFQNFILIGCIIFLMAQKKYKEIVVFLPSILTVLICLLSPVNAYIRYMLPVMAAMPLNLAWCFHVNSLKQGAEEHHQTTGS